MEIAPFAGMDLRRLLRAMVVLGVGATAAYSCTALPAPDPTRAPAFGRGVGSGGGPPPSQMPMAVRSWERDAGSILAPCPPGTLAAVR
jgi:hypothetical protein